jgi:hypothetical protein
MLEQHVDAAHCAARCEESLPAAVLAYGDHYKRMHLSDSTIAMGPCDGAGVLIAAAMIHVA